MDMLGCVDQFLFGETSEQSDIHWHYLCSLDWCFTHQHEFLPLLEEALEHPQRGASNKEFGSFDQEFLYDYLRGFFGWVLPTQESRDSTGKPILTISIPPSLRNGNWLVNNPYTDPHFERRYVYET
jgi:hypothetical protein